MESVISPQQRRSGIPISKTPNKLRINRTISKSNDGNLNNSSSIILPTDELDMFTLIEENINLKDSIELTTKKHTESWSFFNLIIIIIFFY